MRVIFFGTPAFAATVLRHLLETGDHEIVAIVSKPDKPQGRNQKILPTDVKVLRDQIAPTIPLFQPLKASEPEFVETIKQFQADVFVVVAYGEIVKKSVLDIPKVACLNIHASLLPYYRGAAPMQRCLLDGVKETGITIMRMDVGLDSGDTLLQERCPVPLEMNLEQLSKALQAISCQAIDKALHSLESGTAVFIPQEHLLATFAPKIIKEEGFLNFSESAESLHNRVRAFFPSPGAWTWITIRDEKKRLKVLKTRYVPSETSQIGELVVIDSQLGIGTSKGILVLEQIQLEGKSAASSTDFLRGHPLSSLQIK